MAFYSKDYSMLFVHIPKTGGTSVKQWTKNNLGIITTGKKHSKLNELEINKKTNYIFSIVRNPFDRLYSWYKYRKNLAEDLNSFKIFFEKLALDKHEHIAVENKDFMMHCAENNGFNTFVSESVKTANHYNSIWWLQSEYIDDRVDVLRFENLSHDFEKIKNKYKINDNLPKLNTSYSSNYKKAYNKETESFVRAYFEQDFLKFNYKEALQ